MKTILFASLLLSANVLAQTNAVEALRKQLPFYDYVGVDTFGEPCELDFYGRPDGSVKIEMWATSRTQFLLAPSTSFESTPEGFKATLEPRAEGEGNVVMSLEATRRTVSIRRTYIVGDRSWVSGLTCKLEN